MVLAGHPKLKNDLRRPTMEEIGYRATLFSLEGILGNQREYIEWLVSEYSMSDPPIGEILEAEAIELLATRLLIPLQIEQYYDPSFGGCIPSRGSTCYYGDFGVLSVEAN